MVGGHNRSGRADYQLNGGGGCRGGTGRRGLHRTRWCQAQFKHNQQSCVVDCAAMSQHVRLVDALEIPHPRQLGDSRR